MVDILGRSLYLSKIGIAGESIGKISSIYGKKYFDAAISVYGSK